MDLEGDGDYARWTAMRWTDRLTEKKGGRL